ncbi:MAG: sirohydrochlorin chelatase [Lautropia mirabilis]|nr:sirohydrochlorin chelatase [Lautropia mirabilis]
MTTSNDTILLVGHGSREATGNAEILLFAERWRARHPDWRIEVGFIEFADPLLDPALNHAARNSGRVLVLPLILNAAGHVRQDIPSAIQRARKRHPDVQFLYAPHLAVSDPLLRILKRFLRQAMLQLDVPDPRTTGVILLGRGSSDRLANGDVARMARWLWEIGDHERVDLAFTGVTFPRLEKVVRDQVALGMMQIVVMPYYLFTGTLIKRIGRQMENLAAQYPQVRFAHTSYFGFEPEIARMLDERVHALQQGVGAIDLDRLMRPDPFRESGGHHHHHHHGHDHHHHGHGHGHGHGHDHEAHDHGDDHAHDAHPDHAHDHAHVHDHDHGHDHEHDHDHEHGHSHSHDAEPGHDHDHAHDPDHDHDHDHDHEQHHDHARVEPVPQGNDHQVMNDPNQGRSIPEVARAVPQGKPLGPQSAFPKGKAIQPDLPGRPFFPRSRFGR